MTRAIRKLTRCEDELHEAAILKTGFNDFGDPAYRQALRVLLDSFDTDLQLTEVGSHNAYESILRALIARLHAQRGLTEHPDVLGVSIRRPIVITGLPRTGTTALHRLLAVDSQFQGLEYWLLGTPMMRPPRETWDTYPAYSACVASLEHLYTRNPERRKLHQMLAGEVEECTELLMQNIASGVWTTLLGLPTYAAWLSPLNERESYRRYVGVLRLIGAHESHKRWLLKSPYHMGQIDSLLEVLPDACVIQTHRDPLNAFHSACSLGYLVLQDFEGEAAIPLTIGPRLCADWRTALDRMQAARLRTPAQFFDIEHRRFLADPLGIVHSIYEHFQLTLSPDTEQRMQAWVGANPPSRHGNHEYAIDSWGVTAAYFRDTFADYRWQHGFS